CSLRIFCHVRWAIRLELELQIIPDIGILTPIKNWIGCYYCRNYRSVNTPSDSPPCKPYLLTAIKRLEGCVILRGNVIYIEIKGVGFYAEFHPSQRNSPLGFF